MKFLQIGLGSMGKRRIRNLLFHKIPRKDIFGFDLSAERLREVERLFGIKTFNNFERAIFDTNPDVFIISTPPNQHAQYFLYAARHEKHFFVEVSTTDDGYEKLKPLLRRHKIVAAPSCTYIYFEPIKKIKKLISGKEVGRIEAFIYHLGQYLPDWHPWEDYRKVYFARPETSACKEMFLFEIEWLQWILGDTFHQIWGTSEKCSSLEMSADDTYAIALKTKKGSLGTMLIDVVSRFPFRTLRLLGSEGVVEWDWQKRVISVYKTKTKKWQNLRLNKGKNLNGYLTTTEEMYNDEIKTFLEALKGEKEYPYTFKEDEQNINLLNSLNGESKRHG